jgi:periplasmic divalent cation tolerance protein
MTPTTDTTGAAVCVLTLTAPSEQVAVELAEVLVSRSLVACAQLSGPIRSIYRWEGELQRSEEWTLTLKTVRSRTAEVIGLIEQLHPFEVPEVLIAEVAGGAAAYLEWVAESSAGTT